MHLDSVLVEVQSGLQKAQNILASSNLPPLESVQLTFHNLAVKELTGKVKLLFLRFGESAGASTSQDLVLTLTPPKGDKGFKPEVAPQPTAADSIVSLIETAARAVQAAEVGTPRLEAKTLTLNLAFTVTKTAGGGIQFDVGVVSANAGGDVKSTSEQKIRITFSRK